MVPERAGVWAAVGRARSLSAAQDWDGAAEAWDAVVRRNPVHGGFWDRLAGARFARADYAGALVAYEQARELGVWGHKEDPLELPSVFPGEIGYRIACCHARLGDPDRALDALAGAVADGLRDPGRAATDEHLATLRDEPRFRELTGPDCSGLSRVDGWRTDLRVLVAEITRRTPFRRVPGEDFDRAVAALRDAIPDLPDGQIVVGLWRLLRMLDDGHAFLDVNDRHPQWMHPVPAWFVLFAEGLFLTEIHPDHPELLGAQVLAFDGHPVPEVMAALDPLITRDNECAPAARAPIWMRTPFFLHAVGVANDPDRVTLTARLADGTVTEFTLHTDASTVTRASRAGGLPGTLRLTDTLSGPVPAYLRTPELPVWYEHRPADRLVYFQFNGIADGPDGTLEEFYERMFAVIDAYGVEVLVIDLRWNGGGNTFLAVPLLHHVIRRERINRRGGLFVILGRHTFSAAQNIATMLDRHAHPLFVGEPSGSRPNFVGETVPFPLPYSGIRANVSDLYWQTSWPFDRRTAIPPEIYAPPTFAAYRANRDPALDAIMDEIAALQDPPP